MLNKRIIYTTTTGELAIVIPVPDSILTIEEIAKKTVPINTPYRIIESTDIPTDRTFRAAWEYVP